MINFALCYCGGVDHADCVAGGAVGVCRPQIEAAAGTSDGSAVFAKIGTQTPLGEALGLAGCGVSGACGFSSGCFLPPVSACGNHIVDVGETCDPPDGTTCSASCSSTVTVTPRQVIASCSMLAPAPAWTAEPAAYASALWATAPDDAWMGVSAEIRHFDGEDWTTARVIRPNEAFTSFWASSISDFWFGSTIALTHWNGATWTDLLPFGIDLVWGVAPGDVWASRGGRLFHWSGAAWKELPLPSGVDAATARIWSMWGASSTDVWAFGSESINPTVAMALHWDGATWSRVDAASGLAFADRVFTSSWGSATDDIWMSDSNLASPELWHWNGTTWTLASATVGGSFGALWGTGAKDVWSIGGDAAATAATLRHFDGSAWSTVSVSVTDGPLSLLAGSRTDDVWTFGSNNQRPTLYHLNHPCDDNGPPLVFTREQAPEQFRSLVVGGPSDLWAVGVDGDLQHRDGGVWSSVTPFANFAESQVIGNVAGWPANDVWAAGLHVTRWNGTAWIDVTPPDNAANDDHMVWGTSPTDVWVEEATVWMFHWDGTSWSQSDFGGPHVQVAAVAAISATDAWALGRLQFGGTVFEHWDGSAWTAMPNAGLGNLEFLGASALSSSNVWALVYDLDTFDTRMLHYDGTAWTVAATTAGDIGYGGVWASSPTDVWATLPTGGLWHYDGATWSTVDLGADHLTSVSGTPAGEVWATGVYLNQPVIYHHAP